MEFVKCNDKKCIVVTNLNKKYSIMKEKNFEYLEDIKFLCNLVMNSDVKISEDLIKIIEKYSDIINYEFKKRNSSL